MATKAKLRKEHQEVLSIYEGLNLRQLEIMANLMCDRFEIPHATEEGVIGMKVQYAGLNGTCIGLFTEEFDKHCEEVDGRD